MRIKKDYKTIISYILAALTLILLITFIYLRQLSGIEFSVFKTYQNLIISSFFRTIFISVIVLVISLLTGFIFYLFKISKIKYLNALASFIQEIMYGTPLLVLIIISAYVIGPAFNIKSKSALLGVIGLIFYMTPYIMTVFESSISSISEEQYLAIEAFGFTNYQKYRYIIIPQVIRILMPPMMNNFSLIIKGSALLHVLSYSELYYAINIVQSKTFAFAEGYLLMWFLYLIITIPLSRLAKFVERKWSN